VSKKIIFLLTILLLVFYNIEAQKITDAKFKYNIIGDNFIKKQENFPIVRETENYFIIDENEYLIIRENSESDYAIVLDESLSKNIYLKTSIKLGPSENEKSSLGFILKANKEFNEALIFEINNKGKYRIKELTNSTYKYLSNRKNRWIKHKSIKKQNLYNDVKIICENNKIIIFVNQEVLKEISYKSDTTSYSGILIGPDTKARIKYFYLNTDIKQENKSKFVANTGKSLNETFNKNEVFDKLKNDFEILQSTADSINLINKELEKTINYLKKEKINFSNTSSAKDLENKLAKTLKDLESKKEEIINLNEKLKALAFEKKKIKDDLLRKSEKINKLKIELKSEKSLNNSLNVKNKNNQDLISIKSKEIDELNTKNNSEKLLISSLKNKHKQRLIQINKELELVKTENNNILEEKNKLNQKLVSTEKEKEKTIMVLVDKSAYNQIDVIINPRISSYLTNSVTPLKTLEAMAYKKIVLASDVGGMKELIKDGENGILFKSGSIEALEEVICEIIERDDLEEIKENAYKYIINDRNWLENAKLYNRIYSDLINEK